MPHKLSNEQKRACEVDLYLNELTTTLNRMADDKVPNLYGFPYEFYSWDFVGLDLLQVYNEALCNQYLGIRMNHDLIQFIPKIEDR